MQSEQQCVSSVLCIKNHNWFTQCCWCSDLGNICAVCLIQITIHYNKHSDYFLIAILATPSGGQINPLKLSSMHVQKSSLVLTSWSNITITIIV